jgi:uncharacterized protein (TIGR02231 family)
MLRACIFLIALLAAIGAAADTAWAPSRVTAVTIYPSVAEITRIAEFDLDAGRHRLLVPDLPGELLADTLRVETLSAGQIGALGFREARQPAYDPPPRPAIDAAERNVERLQDALAATSAEIEALDAAIAAAEASIRFLGRIGAAPDGVLASGAPDTLAATADMIAGRVQAAHAEARAARLAKPALERQRDDLRAELDSARQALAALAPEPMAETRLLTVDLVLDAPTAGTLSLRYLTGGATWEPSYRLSLDRAPEPRLRVERLIGVWQNTGEDWQGVQLAVSTAEVAEQTAASRLRPRLLRIGAIDRSRLAGEFAASPEPVVIVAPVPDRMVGQVRAQGLHFRYRFPRPVDLMTGAESVLLPLAPVDLDVRVAARATPIRDRTAFVNAAVTNTSGELLLPGPATLTFDGALVGRTRLPSLAAGAEADIGFGPIAGLKLTRYVEERSAGDRGMIRRSNDLVETVVIEVENLTGDGWPLRLTDRVPYSEQADLAIDWTADPRPTRTDPDGRRGLLEWDIDLAPGASRRVTVTQELTWPEDMTLDTPIFD